MRNRRTWRIPPPPKYSETCCSNVPLSGCVRADEPEKRKKTCPVCNYHARLSAKERLDITVDKDSFAV